MSSKKTRTDKNSGKKPGREGRMKILDLIWWARVRHLRKTVLATAFSRCETNQGDASKSSKNRR